jgi:hypothetical protein
MNTQYEKKTVTVYARRVDKVWRATVSSHVRTATASHIDFYTAIRKAKLKLTSGDTSP